MSRISIALLSAAAWARHHLEVAWHGTRDPDGYAAAAHMFLLSLGIVRWRHRSFLVGMLALGSADAERFLAEADFEQVAEAAE